MFYSINKTELARKYGWTIDFFRKKVNTTPGLLDELKKTDYNLYQRIFTPKQVLIIYQFLGNPEQFP
ncbi:MAG: DUF4248 domain-containing protein [Bacteroidota bacterium]